MLFCFLLVCTVYSIDIIYWTWSDLDMVKIEPQPPLSDYDSAVQVRPAAKKMTLKLWLHTRILMITLTN